MRGARIGLGGRTLSLGVGLALILTMTGVAPVGAATVGAAWRASIGSAGVNGTATIQAYTTGSGSFALKLAKMKAATYQPVTLSGGTCSSLGSTLITLPAIKTTSSGTASRASSLTAAQVATLTSATKGTGKIAIRVGSSTTGGVKCGVFTVLYVPIGIVLPSSWVPDQARFLDALNAAGYGVQVLFSRDSATEKANVKTLINRGIKVLILCPQDGKAAAAVTDEARAAGVKVISYDRLILNTASVDYYLTFDGVAVGAAQARWLIGKAGATKGNNLYLYAGAVSDSNTFGFFEGAWEKLQPRIADGTFVIRNSTLAVALQGKATLTRDQQGRIISQIRTNWNPSTAKYLAQSNLIAAGAAGKGTVFILAPNDTTARAIADVFAADKDVKTSYVTGQDAEKASVQYIIDGKQGMTVFKDGRTLMKEAIAAAVAFLKGRTPAHNTTYNNGRIGVPAKTSAIIPVTRDNIQAALIDSGYYRVSDFTGSWPGTP